MRPLAQIYDAQNILSHVQGSHRINLRTSRIGSSSSRIHDENVARCSQIGYDEINRYLCPSSNQVSMNNGQTGSVAGTGKKEHKSQEPSELDRFVYPNSLQSPKCGNNNEPLDKQAALLVLEKLLGRG